ncbi:MAG: hypothetical protein IT410_00140 [Candidatus Doudnabacteria bacterium]|nr:hypothetical protein [Candidatus Doudnabacteria bacterium]
MPRKISESPRRTSRSIDKSVDQSYDEFQSRFALVTKARANIWLTAAVVLFVIGFLAGIVYLADPNAFLQGSISSSESKASFLRSAISQTLRIPAIAVPTRTIIDPPTQGTPGNPGNGGSAPAFTPTLTVTPSTVRLIPNTTSITTRFDLAWDCHLPQNRGEGRLVKKVQNTTAWITDGKVGEYYTEITTTVSSSTDGVLRGSWIALTCTPETGTPVTLRCDVTPASQAGQQGTSTCRNSSGSIVGCTRNLQTIAATPTSATIANGSTTTFAVRVTNNDTAACGPSAFTMSHAPNDGTSNLWSFKSYSPFAAVIEPGATAVFNVPVTPWDHNPGSLDYLFSARHSLTTSTQTQYLSCDLTANVKPRVTITEGNRKSGERDISGIYSPGCSVRPIDALNSTGGYYTGPDDGSLDNSATANTNTNQTPTNTPTPSWRASIIWRTICWSIYGRNAPNCTQP